VTEAVVIHYPSSALALLAQIQRVNTKKKTYKLLRYIFTFSCWCIFLPANFPWSCFLRSHGKHDISTRAVNWLPKFVAAIGRDAVLWCFGSEERRPSYEVEKVSGREVVW
jgi:hypothetical protein